MTFKVGDIVKLKDDISFNFITMKKGTEGVVLEVDQAENILLYVKGDHKRVCAVMPREIEHLKPLTESFNLGFITKEEFTANADKVYAAFSKLSNRVQVLEEQKKEGEIPQVKKPLFKVGDVVKVKERIFLVWDNKFIARDQRVEITDIDTYHYRYIAKAIILDKYGKYAGVKSVSFDERNLELATVSSLVKYKEQHHPLVNTVVEKLQKLYAELLQECPHYHESGCMEEWQNKTEVLLDTLSKLKVTFEIKD